MAQSAAVRQAAYRAKQATLAIERRINTWISANAYHVLQRLSQEHGMTLRGMLEKLIADASQSLSQNGSFNERHAHSSVELPRNEDVAGKNEQL